MKIITAYLTNNPCYQRNKKRTDKRDVLFQSRGPLKLMLHSVGCPQPSAEVFCTLWNKKSYFRACVHAFIDANTGCIYHTLPWNYRGWHAGKNIGNNECLGVEMCEPEFIKYTGGSTFKVLDSAKAVKQAITTYNAAVELFAFLCTKYSLDPLQDITSHYEGYKAGIASNHGDPRHLWKGLGLSYTMDGFRKDVKAKMEENEQAKLAKGVKYKVSTDGSNLNVRNVPDGKIIGKLKDGWTVKYYGQSSGGWYYIKKPSINLEGWVYSKYLKKA